VDDIGLDLWGDRPESWVPAIAGHALLAKQPIVLTVPAAVVEHANPDVDQPIANGALHRARQVTAPDGCFVAFKAVWDVFPVSRGHALLIPNRHVPAWFDASPEEQAELCGGIMSVREIIDRLHSPDDYNIGINVGEAAGQTVFHLHVHVIPRYRGDMADPTGGVRHVIPQLGNYRASR